MITKRWFARPLAALAVLTLAAAACGGGEDLDADGGGTQTNDAAGSVDLSGQTVEVAATWTGAEQERFQMVLDGFAEQTGATVRFRSAGDDVAAYVGPRIEGGDPPDVAIFPQPGVVQSFAEQGDLIELEDIVGDEVDANYGAGAREAGSVDGTLYGVWFRAAQKSTVWYNVAVFEGAGVEPPTTLEEMQQVAQTISDYGVEPYSIGADVGWPLSDLFENIYLRTAGPENYDKLAAHEIPWTDQSVKDALAVMAEIVGDESLLAGGAAGAEQTDFNGSVTQVFADPPKGAIIFEGDFVGGIISGETNAEVGTDADFFDFPSIDGSEPAVLGGGDFAVLLDDTEGGRALIEYLATPEAAEIWVAEGGFISPNTGVDVSMYPDDVSRRAAEALVEAGESVRYDLSDLQPTEFGATTGQGIWGILIDFLRDPSDIDGTAAALEAAAKKAYGG
ncbi:MAG TPA: ABC transporter substrate-binding protein [Actinomycetota bacterium]